MGKNKTPQYNAPAPPKLPTAEELYGAGNNFAKTNFSNAYGAREGGLADLAKGNEYYQSFQPTSFEQALSNKYFQNVWPDTQESIKHGMSLSGLDSSLLLAASLGKARGGLETQIGQYLSDLGNERARYSLQSRIGMDPMDMITPYVGTGMQQGNAQAQLDYDYQQQLAQIAYQQAIDKYNQKQQLYKTIGMISPIGGAIYGGIDGGGQGFSSSLGGTMDTLSMAMPFMTSGFGGGGGLAEMIRNSNTSTPVNDFSMNSSMYSPRTYLPGFLRKGGAV